MSGSSAESSERRPSLNKTECRLDSFGRHIPRVLLQQLIANLTDQFQNQTGDDEEDQVGAFSCTPSIVRFAGALLFVDISGFTVLSQRLPVDELRVCINEYFTIILDTVMRFDGDVIKFAGDALFIVFQAEPTGKEQHPKGDGNEGMTRAIKTAVSCGIEINRLCSNHRVDFKAKKENSTHMESISHLILLDQVPADPIAQTNHQEEEDHAYLNVHSGCSAGILAGIDVGANDRWEYLILGQPIQDVADAECVAQKGELVLSEYAHDILCLGGLVEGKKYSANGPKGDNHNVKAKEEKEDEVMSCGCRKTYNGCYRVNQTNHYHNADKVDAPQIEDQLEEEGCESIFHRKVIEIATIAFEHAKASIMKKFYGYLHNEALIESSKKVGGKGENDRGNMLTSSSLPALSSTFVPLNRRPIEDATFFVFDYFLKWMVNCLLTDVARHVHEADRIEFDMIKSLRLGCIEQCAKDYKLVMKEGGFEHALTHFPLSPSERDSNESFVRKLRGLVHMTPKQPHNNYLREQNQKKHERLLRNDRELTGELRNVIMLFISIHSEAKYLSIRAESSNDQTFESDDCVDCARNTFHFMKRSRSERDADDKLKRYYQTCISLIVSALKEQGGQLRQFIVDDKGTVAIGSFGLRGSSTYDNAASAVEAAVNIVAHFQNLGISATIGITNGRAYCGVVGSLRRHEYAVMGPSVNLSARLMAKGKSGDIICDVSTRSVDRIHSFRAVGEVKAKGYASLVSIFKPVFNRGSTLAFSRNVFPFIGLEKIPSESSRKLPSQGDSIISRVKPIQMIGRDVEEYQTLRAILTNVVDDSIDIHAICKHIQERPSSKVLPLLVDNALNTASPSRFVVVNGSSGIGKSVLISSVWEKLAAYSSLALWNIEILHGKCSRLTRSDPFKPWRMIIRTILGQFSRYENIVHERREAELDLNDPTLLAKKWHKGLEYIKSYLSEEERVWLPLLSTAHIIPGVAENDVTEKLTHEQKLENVTRVLKTIIKYYPVLTNNVLLIVLDDAHSMDTHSWELVHEILLDISGIIFFTSYYDEQGESELTHSPSSSSYSSPSLSSRIFEHSSCTRIHLEPLDESNVKMMANSILQGHVDLSQVEDFDAMVLKEMSGGNPLYIYEIGRALVEKLQASSDQTHAMIQQPHSLPSMERIMSEFRTNRIDEVIYYRFDHLDAQSQLILKIGAIITSTNSHSGFTMDMLLYLLYHDEEDAVLSGLFSSLFMKDPKNNNDRYLQVARQLSDKIEEMIESNMFLKVVRTHRRRSFCADSIDLSFGMVHLRSELEIPSRDSNQEEEELKDRQFVKDMFDICYDFHVSLERKTIYELMLDDQKESLHDRVASYLEKENETASSLGYVTFSDLNEEGYHWEKATCWGNAMSCYYRAGMLLYALGALKEAYEYFGNAYRMLVLLRKDAKIKESAYNSVKLDELLAQFVFMNQSNAENNDEERINQQLSQVCSDYSLRKIDAFNAFGGDSHLLEIAVNLLSRLGQTALFLGEPQSLIISLFEDVLRLILLTWPKMYAECPNPLYFHQQYGEIKLPDVHRTFDSFKLRDPSICFPIISNISFLYRNHSLQDDENSSRERSLYYILISLTKSSPIDYQYHYMQALASLTCLDIENGKYEEAFSCLTKLKPWYHYEVHHRQLVHLYGADRIPLAIANIAQILLLQGHVPQAMLLTQDLKNIMERLDHLTSMGALAYSLTSIYFLCGNIHQAEKCFNVYYYKVGQQRGSFDVFSEMDEIVNQFFLITSLYLKQQYAELVRLLQAKDDQKHDSSLMRLIKKMTDRHYLDKKQRPMVFDIIAQFGVGLECICARVIFMISDALFHMKREEDKDDNLLDYKELCWLGLDYCDAGITATGTSSRSVFPFLLIMLSKIQIILRLNSCNELQPEQNEKNIELLMESLRFLSEFVTKNSFSFVNVAVLKLLEEYNAERLFSFESLKEIFRVPPSLSTSIEKGQLLAQVQQMITKDMESSTIAFFNQQSNEFQGLFIASFSEKSLRSAFYQSVNNLFETMEFSTH